VSPEARVVSRIDPGIEKNPETWVAVNASLALPLAGGTLYKRVSFLNLRQSMKVFPASSHWVTSTGSFPALLFAFLLAGLTGLPGGTAWAISLTGANGRAVEFHLIQSATPKGLTARMVADGPVIGIPWDKLDLAALERDHKAIHEAYLRTRQGETVELNLDTAAAATMAPPGGGGSPAPAVAAAPDRYPGWIDVKSGELTFMLQLPSDPAKGILLVSVADFGQSFERLAGHERGSGLWGTFQNKHDFALLTYDYARGDKPLDPTVIEEFVSAGKGSGRALESAIKELAAKAKQPGLADLPIAIYGAGRTGAAFAYNFVQYRPERILAAVVSKGAFYDAEPSAESAKVPVLLIWGEYCNNHEIWNSENHAEPVLAKAASLNPNWTNGREFRGRSELNPVVEHFGKQYLLEMLKVRLPDGKTAAKTAPAAEPKPEGEGESKTGGSATAGEAGAAGGDSFGLIPVDRAKASKGNVETGEVTKLTDPAAPLTADETFLPNDAVAKLWKAFVLGELEAPLPAPAAP
jgi:hypothetical protein